MAGYRRPPGSRRRPVTVRGPLEPPPPASLFTPAEQRLIRRLRTPLDVQRFLNRLPYNDETDGETLRSFRRVVETGTAHCLEAALFAAVVLEQHGYPPLVLSFESVDLLDHVIFVYRTPTGWGSVARSRDPGLHGRLPCFSTPRALALSYADPYIDFTGEIRGYALVDLRVLGRYDWRFSPRNVWKVERLLLEWPHRRIRMSRERVRRLRSWYRRFRARYGDLKPLNYSGRERWTAIPAAFLRAEGLDV